jgi:hypothetical protein
MCPDVCLTVKPVGEPDARNRHVRFDERGWETGRCRTAQATAPIFDSTPTAVRCGAAVRLLSEENPTLGLSLPPPLMPADGFHAPDGCPSA